MRIAVFFTPLGLRPADVAGKPVLVLDVLRATTTMIAALAHGARAIVPAASPDAARRVARGLAPEAALLAGERDCGPIEGFQLGNSPGEMTREAVVGAAFEAGGEIVILCSGREQRFALEDAYVAGRLVRALAADGPRRQAGLDDAAIAAVQLVRRYGDRWKRAVQASAAARRLRQLGYQEDVATATEMDAHPIVPIYSARRVTVPAPRRAS